MRKVIKIVIGTVNSEALHPVDQVNAVKGCGLEGDRFFSAAGEGPAKGDQVTLIEEEAIRKCNQTLGTNFTAEDLRRNIVTTGVDLNSLVGKTFRVGAVTLKGIKLCHPCKYLSTKVDADVLKGLRDAGGLRASIVSGGVIQVGDEIVVNESQI